MIRAITYPAALATHAETPAAQPAHPPQAAHNVAQASIFLEVAVTNVMTLDVPLAVQPTHVEFVIMDFTCQVAVAINVTIKAVLLVALPTHASNALKVTI